MHSCSCASCTLSLLHLLRELAHSSSRVVQAAPSRVPSHVGSGLAVHCPELRRRGSTPSPRRRRFLARILRQSTAPPHNTHRIRDAEGPVRSVHIADSLSPVWVDRWRWNRALPIGDLPGLDWGRCRPCATMLFLIFGNPPTVRDGLGKVVKPAFDKLRSYRPVCLRHQVAKACIP